MESKARAIVGKDYISNQQTYGLPSGSNGTMTRIYSEIQAIETEGHAYHLLGRGHKRDIGGPFLNQKFKMVLPSWDDIWLIGGGGGNRYAVNAFLVPSPTMFGNATARLGSDGNAILDQDAEIHKHLDLYAGVPAAASVSNLDAFGTSVIASVAPTSPVADLAEFLGELIAERKLFSVPGKAKNLSGEYLNYMFGIAPTVSFFQDLRTAYTDAEKLLQQYARDSGRLVRRRFEPEPTTTTVVQTASGVYPGGRGVSSTLVSTGSLRRVTTTTERWWFSGAFTYHLPKEGVMRSLRDLDKLYGVVPGVDTAWNLLPFSWLVDYKFSVGAALKNANTFVADGLVMPYGYVMREVKTHITERWVGTTRQNNAWTPTTVVGETYQSIQQRHPANPFGFGISHEDLTPRQLSIIAALGLSRV